MESQVVIINKVLQNTYKTNKVSKRDIAMKTGLSLNTINNALNGKNLTLNTVFKIMECFDMNLEDIVAEAKKLGYTFPKGQVSTPIDINTVQALLGKNNSLSQIAKSLNVTENEVATVLQKDMEQKRQKNSAEIVEV
jgi:transcriptional regulator with XRE-family HTH domain